MALWHCGLGRVLEKKEKEDGGSMRTLKVKVPLSSGTSECGIVF